MSPSIIKGDCLPTISIEEVENQDLKGNWVTLDEVQLVDMFSSVILTNQEEEELGNEFCFHETRDAVYFMEKFPGFSDEVYSILAKEQKKLDEEKIPKNELVNEVVSAELDNVKNQLVELTGIVKELKHEA
tara:strand:+ start:279 stop:671 length:393 start_codon:yes stop_codon:yes gene_type:complete